MEAFLSSWAHARYGAAQDHLSSGPGRFHVPVRGIATSETDRVAALIAWMLIVRVDDLVKDRRPPEAATLRAVLDKIINTNRVLSMRSRPLSGPTMRGNTDAKNRSDVFGYAWLGVSHSGAGVGAKLAAKTDPDDRAVPSRRWHRFRRADGGGSSVEA